jgi:hypothetical protein
MAVGRIEGPQRLRKGGRGLAEAVMNGHPYAFNCQEPRDDEGGGGIGPPPSERSCCEQGNKGYRRKGCRSEGENRIATKRSARYGRGDPKLPSPKPG